MGGVGLTKPKARVAGIDAAGRVEAVGANVRGLRHRDEVLGFWPCAFAEHARAEADKVVPKPSKVKAAIETHWRARVARLAARE
jgi:NADPH:quinone reductase-like Zn-dependent oxidoreductase